MSATFAKRDLKMATRTAVWSDRWRSHFDKKLKQRESRVERIEETRGKTIAIRLRSIQPKTLESLLKNFTLTLATGLSGNYLFLILIIFQIDFINLKKKLSAIILNSRLINNFYRKKNIKILSFRDP